jgi:hypothetical protein
MVNWKQWAVPAALLLVFAVLAKCQHDASQRALGAAIERNAILSDSLSVARQEGRKIDSAYATDTANFRAELARWQAMKQRVRVAVKVETLPPTTVPGPVRIVVRDSTRPPTLEEILNAADATIQRCSTALGTCELTVGNLREQLSISTELVSVWRRRAQPSLWDQIKQLPGRAVTTTATAVVGYAACKIGGL